MDEKMMEDMMNQMLREVLIESSIKKPPKYTLRECLSHYTKSELVDLADNHREYISMSKRKDEIIDIVEELILEDITVHPVYLSDGERGIIEKAISKTLKEKEIGKTINIMGLGYVFWFYHNDELECVIPKEVAERYSKFINNANKNLLRRNQEIYKYIKSLQNIYGVYHYEQLMNVWNKYNKEKLDEDEVISFLDNKERLQYYFWWDNPYIISLSFEEEWEYLSFLMEVGDREYYMPTKTELLYHMENEYDETSIYYKRLIGYLRNKNILDEIRLDDLAMDINNSCVHDYPFQEVVDEMNDAGIIFDSLDDLNKFAKLYMDLSNNTRKWITRGYKPVELMRGPISNNRDNIIDFPEPSDRTARKIGRNETCPCGSGKKYKRCCGRNV